MGIAKTTGSVTAGPNGVGDAVGMERSFWFVAIVNNNTEKSVSERLYKKGIEHFLPKQAETRIWKNGRKVKVDRIVIPATVFIYCTERKRKEIVEFPFIKRFMTNRAGASLNAGGKPLAVIPETQIERLKFMLDQSDTPVSITDKPLRVGDKVKVIRGSLMGLVGEVLDLKSSKSELIVNLDFFGCARLFIDAVNLEVVVP